MQKVITKDKDCIELHNVIHVANNLISFLPYNTTTLIHMNTLMEHIVANAKECISDVPVYALDFDDITLCHIFVASKTILDNYNGDDLYIYQHMNFLVSCCKYSVEQIINGNHHAVI